MKKNRSWFLAGLFLTTLSTLAIEIMNTRLLSVATWYHLSFFAVTTAMFGMTAGAVHVYLNKKMFSGDAAPSMLARYTSLFALSVPLSNIVSLCIPIPTGVETPTIAAIAVTTLILTIPFYLSGIVVAVALTRIPGPSGLVYAVDLIGAAAGSIGVLLLFRLSNITSAMFVIGSLAAVGAGCFYRFAGKKRMLGRLLLAAVFIVVAGLNHESDSGLRMMYAKGKYQNPDKIDFEEWTIHGRIAVEKPKRKPPFYWAKAGKAGNVKVDERFIKIDGAAGTAMTRWDGSDQNLDWVSEDIVALPYYLRKGADTAIIGVGGGRDILTALWGESKSVTGIEINQAFLNLLKGPLKEYAGIADDPRVTFVHDEARSFLTRTRDRYDIVQMSLIDTWAATGAGAFTLTENGLYTVEAWQAILRTLKPGGLFSVSRWYSHRHASETNRLVALSTAALLESGVSEPGEHMILVSLRKIATLIISREPLEETDMDTIESLQKHFGFKLLLSPYTESPTPAFDLIAGSRSLQEIETAVADSRYDFSPPTDERPYFFNILKPGTFVLEEVHKSDVLKAKGAVMKGNMLATVTLVVLWIVIFVLVMATVIGPLVRSGLPKMKASSFAMAVLYFSLIGLGFMFVQIPLMQRFSVYLGHPVYSLAVTLFSMILATGIGSSLSDRLDVERRPKWLYVIPVVIACNLLVWTLSIQAIINWTLEMGLTGRILVTVAIVSISALPLGLCFPIGLRLVRRISEDAMPWMWGVNGAFGVLASVSAVAVSIWSGISSSLYMAAAAYALILFPAVLLWRRGNG